MEWKLETKTYRSQNTTHRKILTLVSGKTRYGPIDVDKEIIELGCDQEDNVVVGKGKINQCPIRLETKQGKTLYTCLSKSSATKVNGSNVESCWLQHGDKIQIGNNIMIFKSTKREEARQIKPQDKCAGNKSAKMQVIKLNPEGIHERANEKTDYNELKTSLSNLGQEGPYTSSNSKLFPSNRRRAFFWTFGLSLVTAILVSLAVLLGKGIIFRNPSPQASLEKISQEVMKVAALGNFYEARLILKTAHKLLEIDTNESTRLQSIAAFLIVAEKIRHIDNLANLGDVKQALSTLEQLDPSSLHLNDQDDIHSAINQRKLRWQLLVTPSEKTSNASNKRQNTQTKKALTPKAPKQIRSLWVQAIGFFKSGDRTKSCHIVREIVDQANPQTIWWKKAQSFFARKCSV